MNTKQIESLTELLKEEVLNFVRVYQVDIKPKDLKLITDKLLEKLEAGADATTTTEFENHFPI